MFQHSEKKHLRLAPVILASVFALAAGCGGSGGGSSSDETTEDDPADDDTTTSLSDEETVALAGKSAASTADFGRTFTDSQAEGDDGDDGTTTSATAPVTSAQSDMTCDSGSGFTDDDPAALDIGAEDFPEPPFSNSGSLPTGTDDNHQTRADNCENSSDTFSSTMSGGMDSMARDIDGDRHAQVIRMGGLTDADTPPDISEYFESETIYDGGEFTWNSRGEIHTCIGCVDGDLSEFTGDPGRDMTLSMFLDMEMADADTSLQFIFGEETSPLTMQSAVIDAAVTSVEFDGRIRVAGNSDPGCNFDVTYETVDPVRIRDYSTDTATTEDGELNIAFDGTSYNVTFEADGAVLVDGEEVDTSDIEDTCEDPDEVGFETSS